MTTAQQAQTRTMYGDTYRQVPAWSVKAGDTLHAFGPGYVGREVSAVQAGCECELPGGGRVALNRAGGVLRRLCGPRVRIEASGGQWAAAYLPSSLVWVSERCQHIGGRYGDGDFRLRCLTCHRVTGEVDEPDREPSAELERAWNEQYDGTSLGA